MRDRGSRVNPGTDRRGRIVYDSNGHDRLSIAVCIGDVSICDRFNGDADPAISDQPDPRSNPNSRAYPDSRAKPLAHRLPISLRTESGGIRSDACSAGAVDGDGSDSDDRPDNDESLWPADPDSRFRGADMLTARNGNVRRARAAHFRARQQRRADVDSYSCRV